MATKFEIEAVWRSRVDEIDAQFDEVRMPKVDNGQEVTQDHEWCEVIADGKRRRVRFHDYHKVYDVPGLYEELFYEQLGCNSPSRVSHLLEDVMAGYKQNMSSLRVLDVGAGNGMVGDELKSRGVSKVIGIDIIREAREACYRDRPKVYEDYVVADLTDLSEDHEERLRRYRLNGLTTVAALGFGDIPPKAFVKALDVVETPAWLAFNIKETFMAEKDMSGFSGLIKYLMQEEVIQAEAYRRYRHRYAITGEPLYYIAMVARKMKDLPDDVMEEYGLDS